MVFTAEDAVEHGVEAVWNVGGRRMGCFLICAAWKPVFQPIWPGIEERFSVQYFSG